MAEQAVETVGLIPMADLVQLFREKAEEVVRRHRILLRESAAVEAAVETMAEAAVAEDIGAIKVLQSAARAARAVRAS